MTLIRLYRLHRSGGRNRRLALRLALGSVMRDRQYERDARQLRRAQQPFCGTRW